MKKGHKWAKDITGQKFGKLTAIKIDRVKRTERATTTYWLCKCECGNITSVEASRLKSGYTKSCGCLRGKVNNHGRKSKYTVSTHQRIYRIWLGMKHRCYNTNAKTYKDYGGRGITICDEWVNDFQSFCDWSMEHGYSNILTIDRIDTNLGYSPDNCRWTTMKEQSNNTRKNINISYNGESRTLAEWSEKLNLNYNVVYGRIYKLGWTVERAFETPVMKRKRKEID